MPLIAREQQRSYCIWVTLLTDIWVYNQTRLSELGIRVLDDSAKLSDVIAYDSCNSKFCLSKLIILAEHLQ